MHRYSSHPGRAVSQRLTAFAGRCALLALVAAAWLVTPTIAQETKRLSERPLRPRVIGVIRPGDEISSAARQTREQLATLIDRTPRKLGISLLVWDLEDERTWYSWNEDAPLKPASVLKVFTTSAALLRFGERFEFETKIFVRRRTERDAWDVWVVGAGDPAIGDPRFAERDKQRGSDVLRKWAEMLEQRGVTRIENLYLDDSVFDRELRNRDWPADQNDRWYQAPIGALVLNDNCLDAKIELRGHVPTVVCEPPLPREFVDNGLTIARGHNPIVRRMPDSDIFEFRGSVSRPDVLESAPCNDPTLFFGFSFKDVLEERGIDVRRVSRGRMSPRDADDARLAIVHTTRLADVLWRCNTFSQNLFAECLAKALAAYEPSGRRSGRAGSTTEGLEILRDTLEQAGVDLRDATLRDGCGLSHANRVTAAQIVTLLDVMHRQPRAIRDIFMSSLAIAGGEEGSMRKRYGDAAIRGRIRGKTGSISGVSTLAGYVDRLDGGKLAFALMMNDAGGETLAVDVCRVLVGEAPRSNGGTPTKRPKTKRK